MNFRWLILPCCVGCNCCTDFNRLAQVGLFGAYGESLWGLAQFTLPTESSCLCAFGPDNKSIVGMYILCVYPGIFLWRGKEGALPLPPPHEIILSILKN